MGEGNKECREPMNKECREPMNKECREPMGGSRQNAKAVLLDKIARVGREMAALEILLKVIPWDILRPEDEEMLWGYFINRNF